jgi:hypothetical protein
VCRVSQDAFKLAGESCCRHQLLHWGIAALPLPALCLKPALFVWCHVSQDAFKLAGQSFRRHQLLRCAALASTKHCSTCARLCAACVAGRVQAGGRVVLQAPAAALCSPGFDQTFLEMCQFVCGMFCRTRLSWQASHTAGTSCCAVQPWL